MTSREIACEVTSAVGVMHLAVALALTTTRSAVRLPRAPAPALSALADSKKALLKEISYNKPLQDTGKGILDELIASDSGTKEEHWWTDGCYVLQSSCEFNRWLRGITGPLLDGAPITVTIDAEDVVCIETDMAVVGLATGLRMFGSVRAADDDASACVVTLNAAEFFEPSEEFGITKALNRCEEKLRPLLPSEEAPMVASLELRYADEDLLIASMEAEGREEAELLVISIRSKEAMVTMRARRG